MKFTNRFSHFYPTDRAMQKGFTLVEIMIGMVIGLLATLVITQVMSVFEGQKSATTGTADAQTNGGIALYNIGRDVQFAGYGLMPAGKAGTVDSPLECTTLTIDPALALEGIDSIDPITIADDVSDTITVRTGNSLSGGSFSPITNNANPVVVLSNFGCQDDDITMITNGANCAMSKVTALSAGLPPHTITLQDATGIAVNANISCLGTWNTITYAVDGGNLQLNGTDSVAGIVNIQAQYGIADSANLNRITAWVEPSGATWAAPSVANRNRIKAIRVAIVARNSKLEIANVTTACNQVANTGLCAWQDVPVGGAIATASPAPGIDLSADADWQRYRYRVFETVIPLRNMIWSRDTL